MNILVLGNINSKWVKEYIEYVLLPLGHNVDVAGNEETCKFREFYNQNRIKICEVKKPSALLTHIPFCRVWSTAVHTVRNNSWSQYDVIINMFVNTRDLMITSKIRSSNTKTILYYTGSDLLRKSKSNIMLNSFLLPGVNKYVVGSKTLLTEFRKKYHSSKDVSVISFGTTAFDNIDKIINSDQVHKKGNVFCIGYSGVRAHQHLKVISLFDKLPDDLKKKVELVVPMTYMATQDYISEVKEALKKSGMNYHLLTDYMNNDQMAEMWCGIDYFINAQTTDSLSASVLESIYAGCELINPVWLNYPEYTELGIKKTEYHDFDELYKIINSILDGSFESAGQNSRKTLHDSLGWETARNKWIALFESLL